MESSFTPVGHYPVVSGRCNVPGCPEGQTHWRIPTSTSGHGQSRGDYLSYSEISRQLEDERSMRQASHGFSNCSCHSLPSYSPLHTSEWLQYREKVLELETYCPDTTKEMLYRGTCPQMPIFYCDGRVCTCRYCLIGMYPERYLPHMSSSMKQDITSQMKTEPLSPGIKMTPLDHTTAATNFYFELSAQTSRDLQEDKQNKPKRFQCMHCEKSFGKSSHLRDHIRTHTGDRPFRCQYCSKTFTQYSNLRTHIRIHTGEKPFRCLHCNKSFTQAVTLRSHTRTHTGAKPYHCKRCSKSFACFSGLKGHARIHAESELKDSEQSSVMSMSS